MDEFVFLFFFFSAWKTFFFSLPLHISLLLTCYEARKKKHPSLFVLVRVHMCIHHGTYFQNTHLWRIYTRIYHLGQPCSVENALAVAITKGAVIKTATRMSPSWAILAAEKLVTGVRIAITQIQLSLSA